MAAERRAGPAFYSYAYPQPDGFPAAAVRPAAAFFDDRIGEFLLPYDAVRTAADPDAAVLEFLQSTYEAGADLAGGIASRSSRLSCPAPAAAAVEPGPMTLDLAPSQPQAWSARGFVVFRREKVADGQAAIVSDKVSRPACSPEFGDLRPGRRDEFGVRAGVSVQTPATLGRFGQKDPGAVGEGWIAGRVGHDRRELGDDRQLLVAVERTGVGEDLDPDVGAVAVDVRDRRGRQLVDERGGVLAEHRDVRYSFDGHDGRGEVAGERVRVGEGACCGVDVDHRHVSGSVLDCPAKCVALADRCGSAHRPR